MKFGKRIRTELSPGLLTGSVDYKALKKLAKQLRHAEGGAHHHHHQEQELPLQKTQQGQCTQDEFFSSIEVEKDKVAKFYHSRESWCFLALETTRGALFGLTRRASEERLCLAAAEGRMTSVAPGQAVPPAERCGVGGGRDAAGELEGRFLEAKAEVTVLVAEARDLVEFVDMNMHAFRKVLKKLDKWTGGNSGRQCFMSLVQTQPWMNGHRAHGVVRMASAMGDHLRNLRPALSLGPAMGAPTWADRIVYSVGSFDRPRFSSPAPVATTPRPAGRGVAGEAGGGGGGGYGYGYPCDSLGGPAGAAAKITTQVDALEPDLDGPLPLRFLREFGAVVVVGVYTDRAHAESGAGARPAEGLEARCARVRPHADRVVIVDSADPRRVREILVGAAAGAAAAVAAAAVWETGGSSDACDGGNKGLLGTGNRARFVAAAAEEAGEGVPAPPARALGKGSNNCCFVVCDWGVRRAGGAERRARRDVRALMETSMPVFRLPD